MAKITLTAKYPETNETEIVCSDSIETILDKMLRVYALCFVTDRAYELEYTAEDCSSAERGAIIEQIAEQFNKRADDFADSILSAIKQLKA